MIYIPLFSCRYSIILLALVDHEYRLPHTNIGSPRCCHDAHIYRRSKLCKFGEKKAFQGLTTEIEGTLRIEGIPCHRTSRSLMRVLL